MTSASSDLTARSTRRILILRRENIGDLILTTPLIRALRAALPNSHIAMLVNSYNAPVLLGNPDIDQVYSYTKGKHAQGWISVFRARWAYLRTLFALRANRYDDVILAEPSYLPRNIRLARFLLAGRVNTRVIGFEDDDGRREGLDLVAKKSAMDGLHQAEIILRLAELVSGSPPGLAPNLPASVYPDPSLLKREVAALRGANIALHISARKPSQRWSSESFSQLARQLDARYGVRFTLLWAPGESSDPLHPGDDQKSAQILSMLGPPLAITAVPTTTLRELIDALAQVDLVICADGGAMHVAAALGKPIVALFGDSPVERWRPWGVPHRVLQTTSRDVNDIQPADVASALDALFTELNWR